MDKEISDKERDLEVARLDREIAQERVSASEARMLERLMRKRYGPNWRRILGVVGKLGPNSETVHNLYTVNPELRELAKPPSVRRM